jgi:hypothetical protein
MAINSGVVVAPVEIADLQRVVGVVLQRTVSGTTQRIISGDLGVLAGAAVGDTVPDNAGGTAWTVVARTDINIWAKYKPVRYGYLDTTKNPSDASQAWLNANGSWVNAAYVIWWRNPKNIYGEEINTCGFSIPGMSGVTQYIADTLGAWTYLRPRGVGTDGGVQYYEPFRILDFNQYLPSARCPFSIKSIPSKAVLKNNVFYCKIQFLAPSQHAYNLTLNDIFGQAGGPVYFGVAVVIGNSVYAKTIDDSNLLSLEDLKTADGGYRGLSVGDMLTLVTFITRHKSATWSAGNYQVYSLEAPQIDFATQGICEVVAEKQTEYRLVVSGLQPIDRTVLMPGMATLSSGTVTAPNRSYSTTSWPNPHYIYDCPLVKCTVELVDDSDGSVTLYDEVYYTTDGVTPQITVSPTPLEPNAGPWSQISCSNAYGSVPAVQDPTSQNYRVTYTLIYERQ